MDQEDYLLRISNLKIVCKVCYPHVYVPSLFMLYFIFVLWARADFHQGTAKEATVDSSQVKEKGGKK